MYPFNSTRGYRAVISTFSALGQENAFPPLSFDQRDGQMLVGFETTPEIPAGRGVCGYRVTAARVVLTVAEPDAFRYDATYDGWMTYLPGSGDSDGRPVEMYGAAFRAPWTAATYFEGDPLNPGPAFGPSTSSDVRYVYPTDFPGGVERDVSNNVRDGFDPAPFAIGRNPALAAGAFVPVDTELTFELDVDQPDVQAYLKRQLDSGRLRLLATSLQPAATGGGGGPGTGEFATFYAKEIEIAGFAARLSMTVVLTPAGDADGSGTVDFDDITTVLSRWLDTGLAGLEGDANCDGVVDFDDITEILSMWLETGP
ncbi:MAG TPA: hypothetical protein DEB06_09325 [Phycisphaerales bacterium]|nr:hypothetical protein [Phycisphaerales bacterium]